MLEGLAGEVEGGSRADNGKEGRGDGELAGRSALPYVSTHSGVVSLEHTECEMEMSKSERPEVEAPSVWACTHELRPPRS